ncbi:MAG: hypothetical protein KC416_04020, partial [Myxococcales bacterium]|nr:hypothetical protein [Myxococcales bacterium]
MMRQVHQLAVAAFVSALVGGCSLLVSTDPDALGEPPGTQADGGPSVCAGGCDDGIDCTEDRCTGDGTCEHTPIHSTCGPTELCVRDTGCVEKTCTTDTDCDDGLFCTGEERCDRTHPDANPNTGCVSGVAIECQDSTGCTADRCDEDANACTFESDDTLCDDDIQCTIDRCDPENPKADKNGCVRQEDDAVCQNFCTPNGSCDGKKGCESGPEAKTCEGGASGCMMSACDTTAMAC